MHCTLGYIQHCQKKENSEEIVKDVSKINQHLFNIPRFSVFLELNCQVEEIDSINIKLMLEGRF